MFMHPPDPERTNLSLFCMPGMPDVERLTRKLQRRKCSLGDLCGLYRASSKLPGIVAALQNHAGEHAELLLSRCAAGPGACTCTCEVRSGWAAVVPRAGLRLGRTPILHAAQQRVRRIPNA